MIRTVVNVVRIVRVLSCRGWSKVKVATIKARIRFDTIIVGSVYPKFSGWTHEVGDAVCPPVMDEGGGEPVAKLG